MNNENVQCIADVFLFIFDNQSCDITIKYRNENHLSLL